jgi:CheY-like chemotaxis protein
MVFRAGSTGTSRPGRATTRRTSSHSSATTASTRYSPDPAEPAVYQGRDAIAQSWLENKDEPNTYDAKYEPLAVDGDTFVANGVTRYFNADGSQRDEFYNVYVCRFNEEGECATFTEYWMQNRKFRKAWRDELSAQGQGRRNRVTTVLVVDDEQTVRDTVALRLQQDGHRVITAADGRKPCAVTTTTSRT